MERISRVRFNLAATEKPVSFIERKCPDASRVGELLALSLAANRWANGGPVNQMLEDRIAELAGNRPGRAVVACSNGTAALNVLAGVHALKLGRSLRWAVSAFGFFSTFIGPFTDALVIDCDANGMLDLEDLSRVGPDSYDGVCVTNIFGLHTDFSRYQRFCEQHGKALIIDNAYGLIGREHYSHTSPDEIISLHHTKPWGFGEGGCMIVSEEDESVARSLINFGVFLEPAAARYATNGKLSDVAAAFILARLEQTDRWRELAHEQFIRISGLINRSGLGLAPMAGSVINYAGTAQIAVLTPQPIHENVLDNDHFVIRKYYRPPRKPWPERATRLYGRMINLPCHADMANIEDQMIIDVIAAALHRRSMSPNMAACWPLGQHNPSECRDA